MEVRPPKNRGIKEGLISGLLKFLGNGFYFICLLFGLMLVIFRFGINAETGIVFVVSYVFLGIILRHLIKKKFGVYEYNPKYMSAQEASARADLGLPEADSFRITVNGIRDVVEYLRRFKNNPEFARSEMMKQKNWTATEEARREATIPFYKTNQKINGVINAPFLLWATIWIKLFEVIRKRIHKK
ncbi:MAG: hypothetical protein WA799_00910 [Nitrosotalea sp.]